MTDMRNTASDMASSAKTESSKIGGQLLNMATTIRNRALGTTASTTSSESNKAVNSTIGYQRWAGNTNPPRNPPDAAVDVAEEERMALNESTALNDRMSESGESESVDASSTSGDSADGSEPPETARLESHSVRSFSHHDSVISLDMPSEQPTNKTDTITEWQAGWNVTNAIQGMFIVSFPYTVHQGGYWSLIAMVVVAYICCYTGKILVSCLYEEQKDGRVVRVRSSYGDIAAKAFGRRIGKPIVNIAQVIELLMTCILYVLLCGDLLKGSFEVESMPLSAWIALSSLPLFLCAFIKTMRRVSWLSLWCSVAHMLINIIILIYCFTLVKQWQPKAVKINPSIGTMPIAMGIIVFSYTSQIFLPSLEGKMIKREKFHCMLHWTHIAAALFKAIFSYIGFVTWGHATEELITNNLPTTLRAIVNVILVVKALLSYPLPYFAAVEIVESVFFQDQSKTLFPSCYQDNMSTKWWGIVLKILLVLATMLMAIFIPHFAILMGLIGSLTGTMLSFIWPCVFHLKLKGNTLRWHQKLLDAFIIILGTIFGTMGIYSSSRALYIAVTSVHPQEVKFLVEFTDMAVNETLKSKLIG